MQETTYRGETNDYGQPSGFGVFISENFDYRGEFLAGLPHGVGVLQSSSGVDYKGFFQFGQPNGIGEMTTADDVIYSGAWDRGTYRGPLPRAQVEHVIDTSERAAIVAEKHARNAEDDDDDSGPSM